MKLPWHVAHIREERRTKPQAKIQLGAPRSRWEDNIKMDFRVG
jgi:hypothetical protein